MDEKIKKPAFLLRTSDASYPHLKERSAKRATPASLMPEKKVLLNAGCRTIIMHLWLIETLGAFSNHDACAPPLSWMYDHVQVCLNKAAKINGPSTMHGGRY